MPNWCDNRLEAPGPSNDVKRFKKKAVGHDPWTSPEKIGDRPPDLLNFHSLIPIPKEVLKGGYADVGFDWELENWGAESGYEGPPRIVDQCDDDGYVIHPFATPRDPPIAFLENASQQWPALLFLLDYNEPGNAFKGIVVFTRISTSVCSRPV
jgi:hypothetical protein